MLLLLSHSTFDLEDSEWKATDRSLLEKGEVPTCLQELVLHAQCQQRHLTGARVS